MRKITVPALCLLLLAAAVVGGNQLIANQASAQATPYMPYQADSFFRKALPTNAPVDAARTSSFRTFMKTQAEQKATTWPKVNMNPDWAMSYAVGKSTDPIWKLAGGNTSDPKLKILQTQGFHMPDAVADSFPSGTQDRPGVMIDPVFGYTVQFADAVPNKATRTITVSNAGIMWHSSNALDYRNPKSNDPRNFTSRGRILDAMVIRRDLLDQAVANNTGLGHTLHLFFVETNTADGVVHPMTGAEGSKAGWGAEGERIRISPSVNLAGRGLTGACLAVARTLQQNGAYLGDNSGSVTQIKASQPGVYTGTNLSTDCMKGKVTWDDFEAIQRGYEPGLTTSPTSTPTPTPAPTRTPTPTPTSTPSPTPTSCVTGPTPAATYGMVTQTVNVATAGTYRVWSRIKAPNTTANSYYLQVDNCAAINVGDAAIAANAWTWVSYKGGNTASFIDVKLTAGNHILKYVGKEADVQLDRILLLSDLSCKPTGNGDDCANVDAVNPSVTMTAPANGTSVAGGTVVNIAANATDNTGVTKVEFYVDGALKVTDTTSPYSYAWNTTGVAAGSHTLSARAYDSANNTATSTPMVSVSVTGGSGGGGGGGDTTPPSVTVSVASSVVAPGGPQTVSAQASDNVGVTKVEFWLNNILWNTDTTAPYSYTWNTSRTVTGPKAMFAKAFDAAGNVRQSSMVYYTVGTGTGPGLTPTPTPAPTPTPTPTPTLTPPPTQPGTPNPDFNGDGRVNAYELGVLLDNDGKNYPPADFNRDGTIGVYDLAFLIQNWKW